jgi:hypothetical protein
VKGPGTETARGTGEEAGPTAWGLAAPDNRAAIRRLSGYDDFVDDGKSAPAGNYQAWQTGYFPLGTYFPS